MSDTIPPNAPVMPAQPQSAPAAPVATAAPAGTTQVAAPPGLPSAPKEPAVDASGLEGKTPEELDALEANIRKIRENRPPALAAQIEELRGMLAPTHEAKEAAVQGRKDAAAEADAMEAKIGQIHATLRRTELIEAATAAGFAQPSIVAKALAAEEGDPVELVKAAAASGAYVMNRPAPSAGIGGPATAVPQDMDPGRAALIAEIAQATGR